MSDNLLKVQLTYLKELYDQLPEDLEKSLPAIRENDVFHLKAFGESWRISPKGIGLGEEMTTGPIGILIALYARNASKEAVQLNPLKSFKQIKGSMAYQSAFTVRSEISLVPYVTQIQVCKRKVIEAFDGYENEGTSGDFSFTLYPLPKIPLYYIFYLADEEFPASVTCLFAANAESFMPVDGLADVGELAAKKIIEIVTS